MSKCKAMLTSILITALISLSCSCSANSIKEIDNLNAPSLQATVKQSNPNTTLIVLDIDNTLLTETRSEKYIGSPSWFAWQKDAITSQSAEALAPSMEAFLPINSFVLRNMKTAVCEPTSKNNPGTTGFVQALKQSGFTIVAATARSGDVRYATRKQLNNHHLLLQPKNIQLNNSTELGPKTYYDNAGILYLSGQKKSAFLKHLLVQSHQEKKYHTIIYIDDTLDNLTEFVDNFNPTPPESHTNILAFHYNHMKNQTADFQNLLKSNYIEVINEDINVKKLIHCLNKPLA